MICGFRQYSHHVMNFGVEEDDAAAGDVVYLLMRALWREQTPLAVQERVWIDQAKLGGKVLVMGIRVVIAESLNDSFELLAWHPAEFPQA